MSEKDQRKAPRIPTARTVVVQLGMMREPFIASLINLSTDGLCFISPFEVSALTRCLFDLGSSFGSKYENDLKVMGWRCWQSHTDAGFVVGVKLDPISDRVRKRLEKYTAGYQRGRISRIRRGQTLVVRSGGARHLPKNMGKEKISVDWRVLREEEIHWENFGLAVLDLKAKSLLLAVGELIKVKERLPQVVAILTREPSKELETALLSIKAEILISAS
ncbi:PilZ domain-containing protein [Candidatus Microgenomates bacterium]|nr:PilZ domain-containing protein [Candidatus Microgenomates bacterium]